MQDIFIKSSILPSADTSAHGLGGYIKAAFLIWSAISSSSLNGNVPLRLFEKESRNSLIYYNYLEVLQVKSSYQLAP